MRWLNIMTARLRGLLRPDAVRHDIDEELRFHVEMETATNIERGMTPDEAHRRALRSFGNMGRIKDVAHDIRGGGIIETLLQDLRYGARTLVKHPGFTLIAVIALALGIGANTAIFSVVNTVLLRPLPFKDPKQLVMVWESSTRRGGEIAVRPINFLGWREQNQVFEQVAAFQYKNFNLTGRDAPERLQGAAVSASLFPLLGVQAARGRTFLPEEDQPGRDRLVLVSHSFWQQRFGSDPNISDKTLVLNVETYSVIGVMPPGFEIVRGGDMPRGYEFSPQTDLWVPIALNPNDQRSGARYLFVVARLKPGMTVTQAQAEMTGIARRLDKGSSLEDSDESVRLIPLEEQLVRKSRPALLILLGAVMLVMMISCTNVANLLLARATARQKEIAIRTALGANRARVIRQLLTESLLLALLGGAVGLLLAWWGIKLLAALGPDDIPRVREISIDGLVLGFTLALTLLTGVVFGLIPALQASKPEMNESLKESARGATGGTRRNHVRALLVISEVALSLILLSCAGLLINSFLRLQRVDSGFRPQSALTMHVALPEPKYVEGERMVAFHRRVLERLETLPGVEAAGAVSVLPLGGLDYDFPPFDIEGRPSLPAGEGLTNSAVAISPGYFRAMGIPLLKGRYFTEADTEKSTSVIIINEALAKRFWPDKDPTGSRIKALNVLSFTVVGVVGDVKHTGLDKEPNPRIYLPYTQVPPRVRTAQLRSMTLVVRSAVDPMSLVSAVRNQVLAVDRDQPISNIRTMEQVTAESISERRFTTVLLGVFATTALVLAAVGLYGVVSYLVAQRTHEIGIRMALGAGASDVLRLVIGQVSKLVLIGVGIGVLGALALTRLLESLLYGVGRGDPLTFASVALLLITVALLACYIPARRATKVDPLVALRHE